MSKPTSRATVPRLVPETAEPAESVRDAEPKFEFHFSKELAVELNRIEDQAKIEADRKRQAELARLRELARFD